MAGQSTDKRSMSDEAVAAKTGKNWPEWFRLLDAWGAGSKGHKATAIHLAEEHGLSAWWSQTVTVEYERARGLRDVHETPSGYEVSVSRVIAAPVADAWRAWTTEDGWNGWFTSRARIDLKVGGQYSNADEDTGTFLTVAPNERLRFSWDQAQHTAGSQVEVRFYEKERSKCQVVLQHSRLAKREQRDNLKEGWSWAMDSLRSYLETGRGITHADWMASKSDSKK
jgi:uncharacterized protein YndB with AHSA1/START domain